MKGTATRLVRLLAIRRLHEGLASRTLQTALASVAEVEAALASLQTELSRSRDAGRSALSQGDRPEWLLADAQSEVAGWNRQKLQNLFGPRAEAAAEAMRHFLESRSEHEQVKQLVDDAQRGERIKEDRRAQLAADDWFLSRRERSDQ